MAALIDLVHDSQIEPGSRVLYAQPGRAACAQRLRRRFLSEPRRDGDLDLGHAASEGVIAGDADNGASPAASGGSPKGSRSPWTTSAGTATASSSARRLFSGRARRGASGKARQSTPAAPVAPAVRQATRAPEERPPATSAGPRSSFARSCATTAVHAVSSCAAGAGERRPATR